MAIPQHKRKENVRNYLEGSFSENQIRQLFALQLNGENVKKLSSMATKGVGFRETYRGCHHLHKSKAELSSYCDVIDTLLENWDKQRKLKPQ